MLSAWELGKFGYVVVVRGDIRWMKAIHNVSFLAISHEDSTDTIFNLAHYNQRYYTQRDLLAAAAAAAATCSIRGLLELITIILWTLCWPFPWLRNMNYYLNCVTYDGCQWWVSSIDCAERCPVRGFSINLWPWSGRNIGFRGCIAEHSVQDKASFIINNYIFCHEWCET